MTEQDKATAVLNERLTGHEQLCMERHNNIREDIKELKTDVIRCGVLGDIGTATVS